VVELDPEFEHELRAGLRPRSAPAGFSNRVMQRIEARANRRHFGFLRLPVMRWAMAAVLVLAVALGGYRQHQRRVAGERARKQVLLALRITSSTLNAVHNKIVEQSNGGD
jgi:type VI protein secretion system component VasF